MKSKKKYKKSISKNLFLPIIDSIILQSEDVEIKENLVLPPSDEIGTVHVLCEVS